MKNKIYFLVTLACGKTFRAFYHRFDSGYEARIAAAKQAADDEKKLAAARDIELRAHSMIEFSRGGPQKLPATTAPPHASC